MTEREYGDLKNKIVTAENNYLIKSMAISLCICFGAIGFVTPLLKGPFEFGLAVILWIASLVVISIANPWSKKGEKLDELFKAKTSYEEAEKKLGLKYEPPKNGIYLTPTPVYPAFFIIENVNIFPIVN